MTLKHIAILFSSMLLLPGMFFLQSCKDDSGEKEAEEMRLLEQYILNQNITVEPTATGLYYVEEVAGSGSSPTINDWVEISFSIKLVSNNKMVITTDSVAALNNGIHNKNILYDPNRTPMKEITLKGLYEGITKMKPGGKATLIFPSKLGYGGSRSGEIPGYSSIIIEVELVNVIPDIVQFEKNKMTAYLVGNNLSDTPKESGLVYHEILPGTGDFPTVGQKVTFNYTGRLLNGKVFAQQNDGTFWAVLGYQQVNDGIEESLKLMKEGGVSQVVIPYNLAFGASGVYKYVNNQYYIAVWPYSTVVYDLEILDIEDL